MPRRYRPQRRPVTPDSKYHSELLAQFINRLMYQGKKSVAERVMYDALDIIGQRTGREPLTAFEEAMRNATPILEVRPRRVGGATYQVPSEIRPERRATLAMRWLLQSARGRHGKAMAQRLADELMDAAQGQGNTIKKKEDTHKMAEANRAFAHYRW
ncbi:MAG: 30S ribosomal protein S7 [Chloroflexi bacterium]|nr:30S ribosomal protein S7 [Chloroflexota bacterium]